MKKKILIRCLIGAPIGIAVSTIITILISLTVGDGNFYPVVPELIEKSGNEMNAVLIQAICSVIYGAVWGGTTVIWDKDEWSILRQTITHLLICSIMTFPIAYFTHWMSHDIRGILIYFGSFFGAYLIVWLIQYQGMKKRVQQMNDKVKENNYTLR